jgi:acyl-CoA reductase-like NAD-dependent aldehyde dehydrogenase
MARDPLLPTPAKRSAASPRAALGVGPVIDDDARERILSWIRDSGGELLTGGDTTHEGLIRPTVIANPSPDAKV